MSINITRILPEKKRGKRLIMESGMGFPEMTAMRKGVRGEHPPVPPGGEADRTEPEGKNGLGV